MSESQAKPSRRGFMMGAAVAGAATAAVVTLPKTATSSIGTPVLVVTWADTSTSWASTTPVNNHPVR